MRCSRTYVFDDNVFEYRNLKGILVDTSLRWNLELRWMRTFDVFTLFNCWISCTLFEGFFMLSTLVIVFTARRCAYKRGLCCRPVSVRLSVTLVYCIQTAEDIAELLSRPGSAMVLVFFYPERRYPILR